MISRARLGFLLGVLALTAVLGAVLLALSDVWAGAALMLGIVFLCIVLFVGHLEIITTPRLGIRPADGTGPAFELPDVSRSPLLLAGALTIFFGSVVLSWRISDLVQGDNAWLDDV